MRKPGQSILRLFAGIVICANLSVCDALAQSYPVKPIRMVVGYVPGGGSDVIARLLGPKLFEQLGQPVIVENRPGASSSLATERVAKSPADGYTLLLVVAAVAIQPALRKLPYDLERDLAPVSMVASGAFVLVVHPSVPARNIKELIALARSHPGKLSFGSNGVGGSSHLAGELINVMAKVNIVHVPYKGGADSTIATVAGQIEMSFPVVVGLPPLIEAGKLRALAVTTAKRAALIPSIPTLNESGLPGYDLSSWYGVAAPAGVPRDIIAQLSAVIGKVVNTPEMKESFLNLGLEPQTNTPEQFAMFIHGEIAKNANVIKSAGVKSE